MMVVIYTVGVSAASGTFKLRQLCQKGRAGIHKGSASVRLCSPVRSFHSIVVRVGGLTCEELKEKTLCEESLALCVKCLSHPPADGALYSQQC